ncbi:MAG TPA: DUF1552 domain-containing protein [Gemmataceae bacterium]|jgi:hypothetical protein|nr:DUF1552 domain-containing protein [Gemmataceae bacterium]
MSRRIDRRTALKGLGAAVALPWLEIMTPVASAAPANALSPLRAAFLYVPNGMHMQDWTPKAEGALGELPATLEPLKAFKSDINVFSGLALDKAKANGDGPGDHARAQASFLTGRQARKTNGSDIRIGQSADQWIAQHVGDQTKFSSLEIGIEGGRQAGNCDSGYSCAYQSNFSWRDDNTPNAKEIDPKQVFERLFGSGSSKDKNESRDKRDRANKSILDFVNEEAKALEKDLGAADQRKMEEYLTAVRELELRIQRAGEVKNAAPSFKPTGPAPTGIPKDAQEHMRLMADMMVLAFQADLTRVVTLPLANDGSNRSYPTIGVPDGHHEISHHQSDKKKQEKIQKINHFHIQQLAYLLGKLKSVKEGDKTLLDQVMLVYGSGIGDGNRHNHDDLPILMAGHGGGSVKCGRHMKFAKDTPLMNLYLAMFERMGCGTKTFGDSTGVLSI